MIRKMKRKDEKGRNDEKTEEKRRDEIKCNSVKLDMGDQKNNDNEKQNTKTNIKRRR